MKVTERLGPIISTIIYMFSDIAAFLVIWVLVLFSFAMVGVLTFADVVVFRKVQTSLVYFAQAAFGDFDLTVFDIYVQ